MINLLLDNQPFQKQIKSFIHLQSTKQIMLSSWIRSLCIRQTNCLISKSQYNFTGYRNTTSEQTSASRSRKDYFNNDGKRLFRPQHKDPNEKHTRKRNQNETNVEEYVKAINQINKEFLGIKLNTDYFKVYNQKPFDAICKPDKSQSYKVNDLPFTVKSKNQSNTTEQSSSQSPKQLPNNSATKMLRSMISEEKLLKELQRLAKTYFSDLLSKERKSRMEVNFEAESRKVIETLKSNKWSFKLSNTDATPEIVLKSVTLLKGVKVNRNDNYTVDSYNTNSDDTDESIVTYTLFKKQNEQYPEDEWFAQKFIVARIETEVSNGPVVEVTEQNSVQSSNKGVTHSFVFETDLTVPPSLSMLSLTPEQYLQSYRLKPENIHITNVDNKNIWFNLAYKEDEKKFKLINKII